MFSPIKPSGPRNAKIAICGEAPGRTEVERGEFFVGASGQILWQQAGGAGITRANCYVTNVDKERPPDNNFQLRNYTRLGEPTERLRRLHSEVCEELASVGANITVLVGAEALLAVTGKTGINHWRGSILDTPIGKCIPVLHPAGFLRDWSGYAPSVFDWARIAREQHSRECNLPNPTLITSPSWSQVEFAFQQIRNNPFVAFDIETVNMEIDCIGFAPTPDYAICIPLMYMNGIPYWNESEETALWHYIAEALWDRNLGKIAQNVNYDSTYLDRHGCILRNLVMDTMNAHHCCYPETPKSLEFLTSIYTRYNYYKDLSLSDRWRYNALDAVVTRVCFDEINDELKDLGTYDFHYGLINEVVPRYKESADFGIRVDVEMKNKITEELEAVIVEEQKKLNDLVGHEVNYNSPKQVTELLYRELALDPVLKRDTGRPTADDDALNSLIHKYQKKPKVVGILKALQELRYSGKELSTYARMSIDPDNRVRTTYYVAGTETGRLASQKAITSTGANLQNITKGPIREGCGYGIRSFFVPDRDDDVFLEGDLSGADAMVVAWVSGDPGLMSLFRTGKDIHTVNAGLFFNVDYGPGLKDQPGAVTKAMRQKAKTCGHAANYGIGRNTLARNLECSASEADALLRRYHSLYPYIELWHRDIQEKLRIDRTLTTPLGRKRQFFGRWGDPLFKEAYAYVPQSTVADVIHFGFLRLHRAIEEQGLRYEGVRCALNIHDAITVNTPRSLVPTVLPLMKQCMEVPIPFEKHGDLIIPVEFSMGENWYALKKVTLEEVLPTKAG